MGEQAGGEIHPTAVIHPAAELGAGVRVGPFAVIGEGSRLGEDVEVGPHAVLEGRGVGTEVRDAAGHSRAALGAGRRR